MRPTVGLVGRPRRIGVAERRARLGRRHRLALPATGPVEVAESLVALHGSDPTTVYLSIWARTAGATVADVERALYDDRTLLRLLGMRRTVFAVPTGRAPAVLAACSQDVEARERRKLLGWLADAGVATGDDVQRWLADVETVALAQLARLGEATATELAEADPRLRRELVLGRGSSTEGTSRVGSRVLLLLAAQGRVVRGRPFGSWSSTRFRWTPADRWLPGGLPALDVPTAEDDLARRWLAAFGPALPDDLRWWTGWTATRTRRVLDRLGAVEVDLDGVPGVVAADDVDPEPPPDGPWVALLPALDPTPMGWSHREFYLGGHAPVLFDRTGNVAPSVWVDGEGVGGWGQRPDGEVVFTLLEDVGADAVAVLGRRAADLAAHLGATRLAARARRVTPVERELLAGGPQAGDPAHASAQEGS